MKSDAGKGDSPRKVDGAKYRTNYERIFPRRSEMKAERGQVVDGAEYLGGNAWHVLDKKEPELRDE